MATGTAKTHAEEARTLNDLLSRATHVGLLLAFSGGSFGESGPYYEPTAAWYARVPISWTGITPLPSGSSAANTGVLQWFPTDTIVVSGVALYDALSGGNVLRYAALSAPISAFGFLRILAGALIVLED